MKICRSRVLMPSIHPVRRLVVTTLFMVACQPSLPTDAPDPTQGDTPTGRNGADAEVSFPSFEFHGETPIISNGEPDHWTGKYMNPGGVVHHDGVFHMFLNAFHDWPGTISIGHYTSPDGYQWERAQEDPVFTSDEIPFVKPGQGADVSSVLVMPDGTWVLYFHVVGSNAAGIGRAIASAPEGPWRFDNSPVLSPGNEGEWDSRAVSWPNVIATDDGFVMFYSGSDNSGGLAIGRATSSDGISWTKHNDLTTSEAPFAESDPVIIGSRKWDLSKADRPRAVFTQDGWVMIYTGSILNNRGLALSYDGIAWEQYTDNPIITDEDFPIPGSTWDTNLVYFEGTYFYFMEIGSLSGTAIFLATHEGNLLP